MIITNRVNKVIGTMMNMKKSTKLLPRTNKTMIIITNKVRNKVIGTMIMTIKTMRARATFEMANSKAFKANSHSLF